MSCSTAINNDKGTVIARVHGNYLYESDIAGLVPEDASTQDSIGIVKNYTENWIRTQLMVKQALKNLPSEQLDFDNQLEEYKNSLIIFRYETELIKKLLDTIVSEEEVETYYREHLNDFELKENIVKVQYVIIQNNTEEEDLFMELFQLPDSLMLDSLEFYSEIYAKSYQLDTSNWVRFENVLEIIPIETYNQELFLEGNRFIKLSDELSIYLVNFVDFKLKDNTSPLDFKRDDIISIITNKRKMALIKQVRKDLYLSAVQNKEFEVYYND
jgi:hypothetical protein